MTSAFPVFERRSSGQLDVALAVPDFELLHIEAQDDDQVNGAWREVGFVVNPQAHRHPPYRIDVASHELELLSLGRMLTDTEHAAFVKDLESRVMNITPDRG